MSLEPRAIRPDHLFPGGEIVVWFSEDGVEFLDLGLLSGAALERSRATLTFWGDRTDGSLSPLREDPLSDRLDLLFEAREWNAQTLRAAFLGSVVGEGGTVLSVAPFTLPTLSGTARVSVSTTDGPAWTWQAQAHLGPRSGTLPIDLETWVGLPLRLTLSPPFALCQLER